MTLALPCPSEMDELEQAILCVEAELRAVFSKLSNLKRQRNACIPVARLPSEILSEISVILRDAYIQTDNRNARSFTGLKWICISHVCSSWRQTALATPRLWTCVDLTMGNSPCELIPRARSLPLDIFVTSSHRVSKPALEAACSHAGKLSSLIGRTMYLSKLAGCAADTLRVLEITVDNREALPGALNTISFPRLEVLDLAHFVFDLPCSLLHRCSRSLRHIVLKDCSSSPDPALEQSAGSTPIELRVMFDALRSLQALEILSVKLSLCVGSGAADVPELSLPSLQYLYLAEVNEISSAFCRTLRVPVACRTDMYLQTGRLDEAIDSVTAFLLPAPLEVLYLHTLRYTARVRVLDRMLHVNGVIWTMDAPTISRLGACLAVRMCLRIEYPVTSAELRALCGGPDAIASEFVLQGNLTAFAIAECLADAAGFLPKLEKLCFEELNMDAVDAGDLEKWAGALLERRKAGALFAVEFRGCRSFSEVHLDKLQELQCVVLP